MKYAMRALVLKTRPGVGDFVRELAQAQVPRPIPTPGTIRVRVHSTSINIDDIHILEGTFAGGVPVGPRPSALEPAIPGSDFAGVVDAVGPGVTRFAVGQRVYGMCNAKRGSGPWAEYCVVRVSNVFPLTDALSFHDAATLPVAGSTALESVRKVDDVRAKLCLVVGASGGIGSLCVQALRTLGAEVWGVCSAPNAELVRSVGASRVFDYALAPFGEQIEARRRRVDCVFDFVGGKAIEAQALKILAEDGHFVTPVGPVQYVGETKLGITALLRQFAYIGWRTISSRLLPGPRYHFVAIRGPRFTELQDTIIERGRPPVIDRVVPLELESVRRAAAHVLSHRARGKVVIEVVPEAA